MTLVSRIVSIGVFGVNCSPEMPLNLFDFF